MWLPDAGEGTYRAFLGRWPSRISSKLLSDVAPLILCSELFEVVCSNSSSWKIGVEEISDFYRVETRV